MKRRLFIVGIATAGIFVAGPARAASHPEVTAYRNPGCSCCEKWVEHLRAAGFSVTMQDDPNLSERRAAAGVPDSLAGCHMAFIGDYIIEGHVPATDIARLLNERPDAKGLAVPGMPMGTPGMEMDGMSHDYDVLIFRAGGKSSVFTSHKAG